MVAVGVPLGGGNDRVVGGRRGPGRREYVPWALVWGIVRLCPRVYMLDGWGLRLSCALNKNFIEYFFLEVFIKQTGELV